MSNEELDKSLLLIAKSSIVVLFGIIISKILTYAYRIIIARYFNPEIYGLFILALMISLLFITFAAFALPEGLLRFIPLYRGKNDENKIKYLFKIPSLILIISGIASGAILFLLSEFIAINIFHNSKLIIFLKIFSFLIPISTMSGFFLSVLRAFEKIGWYSFISNIIQNFTKLIVIAALIFIGFETSAIITSHFLGMAMMLIFGYFVSRHYLGFLFKPYNLDKSTKSKIYKELFAYSWPLLFLGFVGSILYWIDSFSLGYYKSAFHVGLYNTAVPIAILLLIVPDLFIQLFFPLITREYSKKNITIIRELSKQVGKWIFIINLPIFVLLILFPGTAINILFGQEYLSATNSLRILSIGTFFASLFLVSSQLISMIGKSKLILINMTLAALLDLILNSIFIPMENILFIENSLGINGAALSTIISMIFLYVLFIFQAHHYLSIIPLRRKMITISIISIIPISILIYLRNVVNINLFTLLILSSLFFLLYIFLVIITKSLDRNDLLVIKSAVSKLYNIKRKII